MLLQRREGATEWNLSPIVTTMLDRDTMIYSILDRSGPRMKTTASPTTQGRVGKCAAGGVGRRGEEKEVSNLSKADNTRNNTSIKEAKKEITIGTWNVRTLDVLGKSEQLDHEMMRYR